MAFKINKIGLFLILIVLFIIVWKFFISQQIVTLNNGLGKVYCPYTPDLVCDYIRVFGNWEENIQKEFEKYVKPGDTVIDAGAFIGTHTIKLSKLVGPTGQVYSFEANPKTFKILQKNVELNNLTNVKIFNKGLSDTAGYIKLVSHDFYNSGADTWSSTSSSDPNTTETITIDSLNLPQLNFMKIDVEGMETKVFMGMKDTIKKFKPVILFESWKKEYNQTIDTLKSLNNYNIIKIKNSLCDDYIAI
jgi:FkbM family methyltransferase